MNDLWFLYCPICPELPGWSENEEELRPGFAATWCGDVAVAAGVHSPGSVV